MDAARRHALMYGVDYDGHTPWLQDIVDATSDLRREFFLNLEASRIAIDDTRELADSHDLVRWKIAHVSSADDGSHVVFAMGFELDISQHDHLVITLDLFE